jgi:hypothetical protein
LAGAKEHDHMVRFGHGSDRRREEMACFGRGAQVSAVGVMVLE